jgi:uncharacterized membrane protein YraQ (UPF0718 family)
VLALGLGLAVWVAVYSMLGPLAVWLTTCAECGGAGLFGQDQAKNLGLAARFFIYETPKILLLLTLVVFGVGVVRSFVTPERTRRILAGRRELPGNVLAALLGIVTPFCSCSAVPMFIGFVTAGVPLGVTFSFLVASPLINEVALVLLWGLFGWKVAAIYAVTGVAIAIAAGWVMGRLRLEKWVQPWVYAAEIGTVEDGGRMEWMARVRFGWDAVRDIVGKIWIYVVLGIAVGAGIHGYVPEGFLASFMGKSAWWAVPFAVLLGVPMYSNAAAIIPVVQALLDKGAALGTVLAFMMAVIGLSLPEAVILRKVLTMRLLLTFFGVVAVGILIVGYVFNAVM